jgi:hypothetical protein
MRTPIILAAIALLAVALIACGKSQPTVQPEVPAPQQPAVPENVVGDAATSIDSVYADIEAPQPSEADALGTIDADLQLQ